MGSFIKLFVACLVTVSLVQAGKLKRKVSCAVTSESDDCSYFGKDAQTCEDIGCCWDPNPNTLTRCRKGTFDDSADVDCDATDGNSCYKLYGDSLKFFKQAQDACAAWGGYLVEITSSQEQKVVEGVIRAWKALHPDISSDVWIGATDKAREGKFVWANSGKSVTYTKWQRGEPNNSRGVEDCAGILTNKYKFGNWNDIPCAECGWPYMCEKDIQTPEGSGPDDEDC